MFKNINRINTLAKHCIKSYSSSTAPVINTQAAKLQNSVTDSKKFPGYEVIYTYDSITTASIMNRMKLRSTMLLGAGIPFLGTLEVMNCLPTDATLGFGTIVGAITLFCHSVGIFCTNNVVGYIYAKKDSDNLIISYVGYFGKRHDVETAFGDVWCPEQREMFRNPIFNKIHIESLKKKLRIFAGGKVIDEKRYMRLYTC